MKFSIQGTNLTLTDEIRELVEEKLADALRPLGDTNLDPVNAAIELERRGGHFDKAAEVHIFRAEATVTGYGETFRAEGSADELPKAIVEMKHVLTRQIRKWRSKLRTAQRSGARRATHGG